MIGVEAALLPLAMVWDSLLGEPPGAVHPVVWMGQAARAIERRAPGEGRAAQLVYGVGLAFGPPLAYAAAVRWGWGLTRTAIR